MTLVTLATLSVRKQPVWDDSPSLASWITHDEPSSRKSWTPHTQVHAHARPKRLRRSECRQVFSATPSLPAIHVHGPRCRCGQAQTEYQVEDELLAQKISSLSDAILATRNCGPRHDKPPNIHRRSLFTTLTRFFSPPHPPSSLPLQADLCIGCADLDIDKVARYLVPRHPAPNNNTSNNHVPPLLPVNQPNHLGITPLMAAVRSPAACARRPRAQLAMVRFLVECCGADAEAVRVDRVTGLGESVLSMACAGGAAEVVRFLVARGVRVDRRLPSGPGLGAAAAAAAAGRGAVGGGRGRTALHVAVLAGRAECVEVLVREGKVDVDAVLDGAVVGDNKGPSLRGKSRTASRGSADKRPRRPVSALHLAHDSYACAKVLLESGADVTVRDGYGRTPLHWAAEAGNMDVVRLLIEAGADPAAAAADGSLPLAAVLKDSLDEDEKHGYVEVVSVSVQDEATLAA